MPIYEYSCEKCGKTIEIIQKMSDKPLRKHEKCGGKLTKEISASAFQFKGTGWYVTDYGTKSGAGGKEPLKDGDAASNAAKESAKSTESSGADKPSAAAEKTEKTGKTEKAKKADKADKPAKSSGS